MAKEEHVIVVDPEESFDIVLDYMELLKQYYEVASVEFKLLAERKDGAKLYKVVAQRSRGIKRCTLWKQDVLKRRVR